MTVMWVVVWEWDGSEIQYDGPFKTEAAAEDWADFLGDHLTVANEIKVVAFNEADALDAATESMKKDVIEMMADES